MTLFFKIFNPIMKAILRSPLHRILSSRIMIITFTGRQSGKKYSTPVSYFRDGAIVICATHSSWWRNIGQGSEVSLRISGQELGGHAVAIPDDLEQKSKLLYKLLEAAPTDAVFYGIKLDQDGKPQESDVERAAAEAVLIKITLFSPNSIEK